MKKRGAGNIEFILAFILFVSFTAAAIYFFNPTRNVQNLESAREYIEGVLIENVSVELEAYSIIISSSEDEEMEVSIDTDENKGLRVVDYYGREIASKRHRNKVCFERNNQEQAVTLYFSEAFDVEEETCSGSTENVRIASSVTSKVISEERVRSLAENYDTDYFSVSEQLRIPKGMDFSFSLELPGEDSIEPTSTRMAPLRREVFSDTQIREVIKDSGESVFGHLTVKAW